MTSDHLAWFPQNISSIHPLSAGRVLDGGVLIAEGRFRCEEVKRMKNDLRMKLNLLQNSVVGKANPSRNLVMKQVVKIFYCSCIKSYHHGHERSNSALLVKYSPSLKSLVPRRFSDGISAGR